MIKKDLVNKKVVRAIALGLSAVMLTTPMTALAAEGDEVDTTPGTEPTEAEVEQNTVVADTTVAINEAQNTISNSEEGSNVVLETPVVLPSTGEEIVSVPDAVEAAGNGDLSDVKTTVGESEDAEEITYKDVIGEAVEKTETTEEKNTGLLGANADLEDAEDALIDVKDNEAAAKEDVSKANKIINEISDNNTVVAEANTEAQAAADKAEEALEEAKAATTEEEAQVAVDKAKEAYEEAAAAQTTAQKAYDENVEKLAAAETKLADAKKALDDAKAAADTTESELKAAYDAVSEAVADAEALKAQVDADAANLDFTAEKTLETLYDAMIAEDMKAKITKKYTGDTEYNYSGKGVDTFGTESASGDYWSTADKFFEAYLAYKYKDTQDYKGGWVKSQNTLGNGLAVNCARDNTYTVTFTVDGEKQTLLYNYHTNADGTISIFTKEAVDGTKVVNTYEDKLSVKNDSNGYDLYEAEAEVDYKQEIKDNDGNVSSVVVLDKNKATEKSSTNNYDKFVEGLNDKQTVANKTSDSTYTYDETTGLITETETITFDVEESKSYTSDKKYSQEEWNWQSAKKYGVSRLNDSFYGMTDQQVRTAVEQYCKDQLEGVLGLGKDDYYLSSTGNSGDRKTIVITLKAKGKAKLEGDLYAKNNKITDYNLKIKGNKFVIDYTTTTPKTVTETKTWDATTYTMNKILTGTEEVDCKYWTETRDGAYSDEEVEKIFTNYKEAIQNMQDKKDAAAIALAAALQAKADVEKAQLALKDLEIDDSAYTAALGELEKANAAYEKATEDLAEANQAAEDAEQDYKDAAAELGRFIPDPSTGGESGGTTGGEGGTTGGTTPATPVVPVVPGAEIAEGGATVTPVATGAGAGAGAAVVDIEDEETPLAAGIDNGNGNGDANGGDGEEVLVAGAEEDETAIVAIEDEETPLAAGSGADGKMSWWWLLIVALLGATGYKMYKDHQKKKEEAAQEA